MRAVTHALLPDVFAPTGPILELGCGAGVFTAELTDRYPARFVFGTDIHPLALSYSRHRFTETLNLTGADLQHLPFADTLFSLVLGLDVIDQKGVETNIALAESWRVLQPQGLLLLRVSAYPWLQGTHDAAFNTGRRFVRTDLVKILQSAGFTVLRTTYANTLLAPAIAPIRLLQRWGYLPFRETYYTAPLANRLLAFILQQEARWLHKHSFHFGISLYALAQKKLPAIFVSEEQEHVNRSPCLHSIADLQ